MKHRRRTRRGGKLDVELLKRCTESFRAWLEYTKYTKRGGGERPTEPSMEEVLSEAGITWREHRGLYLSYDRAVRRRLGRVAVEHPDPEREKIRLQARLRQRRYRAQKRAEDAMEPPPPTPTLLERERAAWRRRTGRGAAA